MDDTNGGGLDRESTGNRASVGLAANATAIVVGFFTAISLVISIVTTALQNWPMVAIASGSMILLATILYSLVAGVRTLAQNRVIVGALVAGFVLAILGGVSLADSRSNDPLNPAPESTPSSPPRPPPIPLTASSWQNPGPPNTKYPCGAYNTTTTVWFQECVIVTPTSDGAHVQSLLAVSNQSSIAQKIDGETYLYLGSNRYSGSTCGTNVVLASERRWCYSSTNFISGHGRDVQGQGHLFVSGFRAEAISLTVKT